MGLGLQKKCPECNGSGAVWIDFMNSEYTCGECHGKQTIPTDQGLEILDLISKHLVPQGQR